MKLEIFENISPGSVVVKFLCAMCVRMFLSMSLYANFSHCNFDLSLMSEDSMCKNKMNDVLGHGSAL